MNETMLSYCIRVDFQQLGASGRQETNQVTIFPSLLLPNWLPGALGTDLLKNASWLTGTGGQAGADSSLCLKRAPKLPNEQEPLHDR